MLSGLRIGHLPLYSKHQNIVIKCKNFYNHGNMDGSDTDLDDSVEKAHPECLWVDSTMRYISYISQFGAKYTNFLQPWQHGWV